MFQFIQIVQKTSVAIVNLLWMKKAEWQNVGKRELPPPVNCKTHRAKVS